MQSNTATVLMTPLPDFLAKLRTNEYWFLGAGELSTPVTLGTGWRTRDLC
jgi:hypothetical protein